ncbi:MAG: hypothetical protein ACFFCV_07865 [Promethearchaeota archaeon]
MIVQTIGFLEALADIFGIILIFFKQLISSLGSWMISWITATIDFLQQNLGNNLTIFIIICVILVVSGIFVNIIWPGDRPGSLFSKGIGKIEELDGKIGLDEERDIIDAVRRCKDCGNPIGDAEVCSLCGARN